MYLVYDIITKDDKQLEVIVNFPSERYDGENAIDYQFNLQKTIRENIISKHLSESEIYELIDILNQVEENQLSQIDTIEMLERASTKKLRNLSFAFRKSLKEGVSIVETLKEASLPRYIVMSLESAQKGGKLGSTYVNIMDILKLRLDTQSKISKILRYPKIVFGFLIVYFFVTIFFIIPSSLELISMMDPDKFPEVSKKLYSMSEYALKNQITFVLMTLFSSYGIYKALYFLFGKLVLFIPAIRKIEEYKDISLFFSILSSLQESGILLHNSIKFASEIITNKKMKNDLLGISKKLRKEGGTFFEELQNINFEQKVCSFVFYGEKSGTQNVYFKRIKNIYSKKMNDQIDIALEFINPITMIFTVGIMLTLYIGVNAPLLTFGQNM